MAAAFVLAYFLGSVPMAYLVGRATKGIDIRRYGSGNVGASNTWGHVGKAVAVPVIAFDLLVKGALSVYIAQLLNAGPWVAVACGVGTVTGHNWSLYLKFTGGRGVLVVVGVLAVLAWKELALGVLITASGWAIFRSSALWVGIGVAALPLLSITLGDPPQVTALCVGLVATVALKRLLANGGFGAPDAGWRRVFLPRLLHDRDVATRDEWVKRTPLEDRTDV